MSNQLTLTAEHITVSIHYLRLVVEPYKAHFKDIQSLNLTAYSLWFAVRVFFPLLDENETKWIRKIVAMAEIEEDYYKEGIKGQCKFTIRIYNTYLST